MPAARRASAGQIKAAERRVLVEIAQDIGELQRAAEMMRKRDAVLLLHAEHPHRQPPDRARDAVAIAIEGLLVGRADVGDDIHLHAVDDVVEILPPESEFAHRAGEARQCRSASPLQMASMSARQQSSARRRSSRGPLESAMSSTCRQNE